MKVAILTSLNQWFVPFAEKLQNKIPSSGLFFEHKDIDESYTIVFILSYHKIIEQEYLEIHQHNIVVHASLLPKGKGWAPMFWQVLEGKSLVPFTMFEAGKGIDDGDIYMQRTLSLSGYELNTELREKQAEFTIMMCEEFLKYYEDLKIPRKQIGEETFYSKRNTENSMLDVNKTIKEQFNLLRIVNNKEYPAFFEINGHRYTLKIEEDKEI